MTHSPGMVIKRKNFGTAHSQIQIWNTRRVSVINSPISGCGDESMMKKDTQGIVIKFLPMVWGRRDTSREPTWEEAVIMLDEIGAVMMDAEKMGFVALFDLENNRLIIRKELVP